MAVTSYNEGTQTFFRVRVQLRSNRFPAIRFSEQVSEVKTEAEAQRIEVRLQKELQKKVTEKELQRNITGQNWSCGGVAPHSTGHFPYDTMSVR